jgi:hypothetical protein
MHSYPIPALEELPAIINIGLMDHHSLDYKTQSNYNGKLDRTAESETKHFVIMTIGFPNFLVQHVHAHKHSTSKGLIS